MKPLLPFGLALAALMLGAGCASSPGSRIAKNRAEFEGYPPAVQAAIEAGRVEVGFTPAQARLALGSPDRVVTRTTATGSAEVWVYEDKGASMGFGLGVGLGGGPVGGGVGVGAGGRDTARERLRVVFEAGRVSAVEQVSK
jgi:hypothetical protein